MESPKVYGITRKRVYDSPCGLIPYNAISIDSILAVGEIPYRNKLRIPYAHFVSDSIHGYAVI